MKCVQNHSYNTDIHTMSSVKWKYLLYYTSDMCNSCCVYHRHSFWRIIAAAVKYTCYAAPRIPSLTFSGPGPMIVSGGASGVLRWVLGLDAENCRCSFGRNELSLCVAQYSWRRPPRSLNVAWFSQVLQGASSPNHWTSRRLFSLSLKLCCNICNTTLSSVSRVAIFRGVT